MEAEPRSDEPKRGPPKHPGGQGLELRRCETFDWKRGLPSIDRQRRREAIHRERWRPTLGRQYGCNAAFNRITSILRKCCCATLHLTKFKIIPGQQQRIQPEWRWQQRPVLQLSGIVEFWRRQPWWWW